MFAAAATAALPAATAAHTGLGADASVDFVVDRAEHEVRSRCLDPDARSRPHLHFDERDTGGRVARFEARYGHNALFWLAGSLWPVLGFLLSFALIASRETVPFLYFQF